MTFGLILKSFPSQILFCEEFDSSRDYPYFLYKLIFDSYIRPYSDFYKKPIELRSFEVKYRSRLRLTLQVKLHD